MDNQLSSVDRMMRQFLEEYLFIMSQVTNERERVELRQKIQHKMQEILSPPVDEMLKSYSDDLSKRQEGPHTNFNVKKEEIIITPKRLYKYQLNDEQILYFLKSRHSKTLESPFWIPITDCHDFCTKEPWFLPGAKDIKGNEVIFFYVPSKKKKSRTAGNGFWQCTDTHRIPSSGNSSEIEGYKRAFTFYVLPSGKEKRSSKGENKTKWRMYEYELKTPRTSQSEEKASQAWTICRISNSGRIGVVQNEVNLKTSDDDEIVDSQQKEIVQPNYYSRVDEFEKHSQEKRGMYRDSYQSQEIAGAHCHVSGMHSTVSTMTITHSQEGRLLDKFSLPLSSGDGSNITNNLEHLPFLSFPSDNFGPLYSPEADIFYNPEHLPSHPLSIEDEGIFFDESETGAVNVHVFQAKDSSHERNNEMQAMLAKLRREMKAAGYIPDTNFALYDLEEEEKESEVWYHSEKLALVFGHIAYLLEYQ